MNRALLKNLWNIAGKVRDLDAELKFFEACGATDVVKDVLADPSGKFEEFAMLRLGGERLLLFPNVVYEPSLPEELHYGLTHAVFEVESLDEVLAAFQERRVRPFWGPSIVSAGFRRRRIAFFRSPSGIVIEAVQELPA